MMQWKALSAFGDTTLTSTVCYCLNSTHGLKRRDENPRPKLISTKDITGKTKIYKGAFNNYVDQILTNFDPLLPSSGQAWTFYIPPPLSTWTKGGQKPPPPKI